jgi:muramidase (phage lysozyme)
VSTFALDRVTACYANPNWKAFIECVKEAEPGRHDDAAYTLYNSELWARFGHNFTPPPWRHPFHGISTTKIGHATACGAGQFLGTTWAGIAEQLGFGDGDNSFTPLNQDLGIIQLAIEDHAAGDIENGDIWSAVQKCSNTWIAFRSWSVAKAREVFARFGGAATDAPAPDQPPAPVPAPADPLPPPVGPVDITTSGDASMGFLAALLPTILSMFEPLAAEKLGRVLKQPPAVSDAFTKDLFTKLGQLTGVDASPDPNKNAAANEPAAAAQAYAALAKAKADNTALVAQLQQHALDYLDKIAPIIRDVHTMDMETSKQQQVNMDAAVGRINSLANGGKLLRAYFRNVQSLTLNIGIILGVAMLLSMIAKPVGAYFKVDMPDWVPMILPVLAGFIGQLLGERKAISAFLTDGTPQTNAQAMAGAVVQQALKDTDKRA